MKDKKCKDFVFMPISDGGRPGPRAGSAPKATPPNATPTESQGASSGGATEVRSKIVVVGACGCGKTALVHRYVRDSFTENYTPTGFDTYTSHYSVSDTYRIYMSMWDTSGDTGYDAVRPLSYSEADLIIICFSIDQPETMEDVITKWHPEVKEHCPSQPIMLVGCKSDRRGDIRALPPGTRRPEFVTYDQGLKTAKHIGALVYSETSAKSNGRSVSDVMEVAALSSAGAKNGSGFTASASTSGTTTTASNTSTGSSANSNSSSDSPNFQRNRSFIRRKRFTGMSEAKVHLRKEAAKSCAVM